MSVPPAPQFAPQFAWDVDRYHRAIEAGIFTSDDRIELVEGELLPVPPIGPRHAALVARLNRQIDRQLGDEHQLRGQSPITLPPQSEPEPDLAVVRQKEDWYAGGHPGPAETLIAIEVSDTTRGRDERGKLPLYARHGIPEFWVVYLNERVIHVYSALEGDRYTEHSVVAFADGVLRSPVLDLEFALKLPHDA